MGLLPLALLALLLGPILAMLALVWVIYFVRKPRARLTVVEGPYPAPLDAAGKPVYPARRAVLRPRWARLRLRPDDL